MSCCCRLVIYLTLLLFSSSTFAAPTVSLPESGPIVTCEQSEKDCAGVCFGSATLDCAGVCNGDAVLDDCGQCNGNNELKDCNGVCNGTAIVDCNGVCNGGVEFDSCGECGGDGSSCKECVYEVRPINEHTPNGSELLSGEGSNLSCIDSLFENLAANLDSYINSGIYRQPVMDSLSEFHSELEPYVGIGLSEKLRDGKTCNFQAGSICISDDEGNQLIDLDETLFSILRVLFISGDVYLTLGEGGFLVMDENCNPVAYNQDEHKMCGALEVRRTVSPISLYWEPLGSFEIEERLVNFPLNPYGDKPWSTWRASGKLPLVVWDPEHTGKINSATQLFGNWTFGGKNRRLASIGGSGAGPTPWNNGYEALGTLDLDGDQKVSGAELDSLGLWFDYNQNGVSEEGEVISIKDAGVAELYYQPDHTDPLSQDLYVSNGYKRIVDGKELLGASVDWFGKTSKSYAEGVQIERMEASISSLNLPSDHEESNNFLARPNVNLRDPFLGVWRWSANAEDFASIPQMSGADIGGYLVFTRDKSGIKGMTISEYGLKKNSEQAKSLVQAMRLSGFVSGKTPQDAALNFKINNHRGETTFTKASVSGSQMVGQSSTKIQRANGTSLKLDYGWTAQRIPYSQLFPSLKQQQ